MHSSDKFHDECGVVAIFAHPEAEKLAYLGLHALQHRGQESAGIVTSDGLTSRTHKAMGSVADIFTDRYVTNRLSRDQQARLLERPDLMHVLGEHDVAAAREVFRR